MDKVKALLGRGGDEYLCLVGERDRRYYDFPGGGVELGESVEDGLFRELDEELGFANLVEDVNSVEPIPYCKTIDGEGVRNVYPFHIDVGPDFEPDLSDEHIGYEWLGADDLRSATEGEILTHYRLLFFEYTRRFRDKEPSNPPVFEEGELPNNIQKLLDEVE